MLSLSKVSVSEDGTVTSEWTEQQTMHSPPKDFERTAGGCRKFPVQFKLKVIDYVKAGHSNTATARHFKVNRKVVRDWLRKEEQLRRAAATVATSPGPGSLPVPRIPGALGHYPWAKGTTVKELLQEARNKKEAKVLPKRARGRNHRENFAVLKEANQTRFTFVRACWICLTEGFQFMCVCVC